MGPRWIWLAVLVLSFCGASLATIVASCQDEYDDCWFEATSGVVTGPYGTNCDQCISLSFEKAGVMQFPDDAFDTFAQLRNLDLSQNNISSVPSGFFDGLVNLRNLNMSMNYLTTLPPAIFDRSQYAEIIDLSKNMLDTLPHNIFNVLEHLDILDLRYNQLECYPSNFANDVSADVNVSTCCEFSKQVWDRSEVQHCSFNAAWNAMPDGTHTGGLGKLMVRNEYEVWVCVEDHDCSLSADTPMFCFVYDEIVESFVPWGDNTCLCLKKDAI